ncbi:MAG: ComF family protein [Proteobacteria bacterium]|nr:ComF family protein [Pseudomonadota bacterium]
MNSPPHFNRTYYACTYQAPVDKWIMSLKFGSNILISKLFAELLSNDLNKIAKDFVLMPVPLHKSRLRKRGFNQAYEIAKELARYCHRELDTSLIRIKNTQMQAQLKFKERITNVRDAFEVRQPLSVKKVILVDDVMTTGNTLKECAKTLKKAGVEDVTVLVFARKF